MADLVSGAASKEWLKKSQSYSVCSVRAGVGLITLNRCLDPFLNGLVLLMGRRCGTVVFVCPVVGDQPIIDVLLFGEYTLFWFVGHVNSCLFSGHVHTVY